MHLRSALCAALLLVMPIAASASVQHYCFGLSSQTTYDVWQGDQLIAEGTTPGPAGELAFNSDAVSPITIIVTGENLDTVPPATVDDLWVDAIGSNSITLTWTAVGDDGSQGQASSYDLRFSTAPISEGNWGSALPVSGEPLPKQAGEEETYTVGGLSASTTYYFAIKVADERGNWSGLSNVPSETTLGGSDSTPPYPVFDLDIAEITEDSMVLTWTSVGDDGDEGQASTYDVRYASYPVFGQGWETATQVLNEPAPQPSGMPESLAIHGLQPETIYYFGIKIADEVPNWSTISNIDSGETLELGDGSDSIPPADIDDLEVSYATARTVGLTWIAVGDDGHSGRATSYDLRYALEPITGETWGSATKVTGEPIPRQPGGRESFSVGALEPLTTYYFAIKVADEVPNWSGLSNIVSQTTLEIDDIPPAAIEDLQAVLSTPTTTLITWVAVGDDSLSGRADRYDIRYATEPIDESNWDGADQALGEPDPAESGQSEAFQLEDLEPSTSYYIALKVADEVQNWSEISNIAATQTTQMLDDDGPEAVIDLAVIDVGHHSVRLDWTAPYDDEESEAVTSYEGRYDTSPIDEDGWAAAQPIPGLPTPSSPGSIDSVLIAGLEVATTYYFALRAIDEAENAGEVGNIVEIRTTSAPDTSPPSPIADLAAIDQTATTITLRWQAPSDSIPPDCIEPAGVDSYDLRFSMEPINAGNWETGVVFEAPVPGVEGSTQDVTIDGLSSETTYYFAIRSVDLSGNWSEIGNVVEQSTDPIGDLPDNINPGLVTDLEASSLDHQRIRLDWTAPGGDGDAGQADHYEIRRSDRPLIGEDWASAIPILPPLACRPVGEPEELTVDGLEPRTSYYFALRAIDAAGNAGPISESVSVRTTTGPDMNPPTVIANLQSVYTGQTSAILRWTSPQDDRGFCASYDLRFALFEIDELSWDDATPIEGLPAPLNPGLIETHRVTGLPENSTISVAIRSSDFAGNESEISNLIWLQTEAGDPYEPEEDLTPPAMIGDLDAVALDANRVLLTWSAVGDDDSEGSAFSYELRKSEAPIDGTNWTEATPVAITKVPRDPGDGETFVIGSLTPDSEFHFILRALDEAGNAGDWSADVAAQTFPITDTHPPTAPSALSAILDDDKIHLTWSPSVDPDVVDYVVYRRETDEPSDESLAFLNINAVAFTDDLILPDVEYAYTVAAKDRSGNVSRVSGEVLVLTQLEGFLPVVRDFIASSRVTISPEDGEPWVAIEWTAHEEQRFGGYVVERSVDQGVTWRQRTNAPLSGRDAYVYEEAIEPGTYLYRVSALSPRGYARPFTPIPIQWLGETTHLFVDGPYPNPSPGAFHLRLQLGQEQRVRLELYDLTGRRIALIRDEIVTAGLHSWTNDPLDAFGQQLSAGIYLLRVATDENFTARKLIIRR